MNRYINVILIFIIIGTLIFTSSCRKSYLDVEDNSVILREQYVTNIETLQQYLDGIYISLARDFYLASVGPQIYTDLIADNVKPSSINTSIYKPHYSWNQSSGSSGAGTHMDKLWRFGYLLIRACSFAIDKADELKGENTAKANQIKGEAYALRALVHFVLVNTFAQSYNYTPDGTHPGIPYVNSWDWNDPIARNSVKQVYDGMISDLTAAIALLPSGAVNKLTMNQYAAKALLARIYLFKEDWQQAKTLAAEVAVTTPLLAPALYPAKLFTSGETEALFQLPPSSTQVVQGSYDTNFPGCLFRNPVIYFLATKDISNILLNDVNDRRNAWIIPGGAQSDSIAKFPINVVTGFGTDVYSQARAYYQTLFRSSEMFLTVAEAAAKTGDENTARTYLDAIRQRANPTALGSTGTGTALLDSIHLERRKELAFEGFRMWDLLRWKQGVQRTDVATGGPTTLPYPSNKAIAPIPMQDVNYGIPQNTSY